MATTPIGTRRFLQQRPFASVVSASVSPTGHFSAATLRRPAAISATRRGEAQAVQHHVADAAPGRREVLPVGGQNIRLRAFQRVGHLLQRGGALRRAEGGGSALVRGSLL